MKHDIDYYEIIVHQFFGNMQKIDWNDMSTTEQAVFRQFMVESLITFDDNTNVINNSQYYDFLRDTYNNIWLPLMHNVFNDMNMLEEKLIGIMQKTANPVIVSTETLSQYA